MSTDSNKPTTAFPETDVELLGGRHVVLKPWTLKQGRMMRQRVASLWNKLQQMGAAPTDLEVLLEHFESDVYSIVMDTLEWDEEQMNSLAYEDLVTLAEGIIKTCILRPDGGGVLGKLLGAAKTAGLGSSEIPASLRDKMSEVRTEASRPGESETKPPLSLSSLDDGAPTPSDSEAS